MDMFSLLKFLKIPTYSNLDNWNQYIAKPLKSTKGKNQDEASKKREQDRAFQLLQGIRKDICLRRCKTDTLDGEPLVELPKRTFRTITLKFTSEERDIYAEIEKQAQQELDQFMDAGEKSYTNMLLCLLRLRQATYAFDAEN